MTIKTFLLLLTSAIFVACSVGTSTVPKGSEFEHENAKKINEILMLYTHVYKLNIDGSNLNLTIGMTDGEILHYRRRGFYVDRLMVEMADHMDSIRFATIKVTNLNDFLKTVDTYTYDNSALENIKKWKKEDPFSLYILSMVYELNDDKYEELSEIARLLSQEIEDEKKLNTFDPDFHYYVDKFVNEIYGNPEGTYQRKMMENFYRLSFDTTFKHLKPTDVLRIIDYADSLYYLKKYPTEIKSFIEKRREIQ
jgi:hypothetical protein